MLEKGEYVLNRKAVEGVGVQNLDKLNYGTMPRFQTGGQVINNLHSGKRTSNMSTTGYQTGGMVNQGGTTNNFITNMYGDKNTNVSNPRENGPESEENAPFTGMTKQEYMKVSQGYQTGGMVGEKKTNGKVFLHWAGSGYSGASPSYHATIQGDGSVSKTGDYNTFGRRHTWSRNSQGIGISLAAMAGGNEHNFGKYPVKDVQYEGMAKLVANILEGWNQSPSYVNVNNIMTHAEAGRVDGYGPGSGDPETRWDLWMLKEGEPPWSGGDKILTMIKGYMGETGKREVKPLSEVILDPYVTKYTKLTHEVESIKELNNVVKKPETGQIVKVAGDYRIYGTEGAGWSQYKPTTDEVFKKSDGTLISYDGQGTDFYRTQLGQLKSSVNLIAHRKLIKLSPLLSQEI